MAVEATKYCMRCGKTLNLKNNFYRSNNLEKYPDGYLDVCKDCFLAHLDPWDLGAAEELCKEADIPFMPDVWNEIMARLGPTKITPKAVYGRYTGKMKLNAWKDYRYADTENLRKLKENSAREALKQKGLSASEIDEAIASGVGTSPDAVAPPKPPSPEGPAPASRQEINAEEMGLLGIELTEEDTTYLRIKWGTSYRPFEWVQLERLYQDMMASYDIQTAGHKDTLKLICKASLKANQLFDLGDVQGALQATKVYDQLMKSGKFTAAQNKAESGEFVDSVSEIAMQCETSGFIPRFYQDSPNDKVDYVIKDNQTYMRKLITDETNLSSMIERSMKLIEEDKAMDKSGDAIDEDEFAESLFEEDAAGVLSDEDLTAFREFEEELGEQDAAILDEQYDDYSKDLSRKEKKNIAEISEEFHNKNNNGLRSRRGDHNRITPIPGEEEEEDW